MAASIKIQKEIAIYHLKLGKGDRDEYEYSENKEERWGRGQGKAGSNRC